MYSFPKEDGNGPIKSMAHTSKISTTMMGFNGIISLLHIIANYWHLG